MLKEERSRRPAALRDVLDFVADISTKNSEEEITTEMMRFNRVKSYRLRGEFIHYDSGTK